MTGIANYGFPIFLSWYLLSRMDVDAVAVAEAMKAAFNAIGESCCYHVLDLDTEGVKTL